MMFTDGWCAVCLCVSVCVMFADLRQKKKKRCLPSSSSSSHLLSLHLFLLCLFPPIPPEQARRELRRLKEEARRKHAVAVIWAYWQGLKVPTSPTAQPSPSLAPTHHPRPLFILHNHPLLFFFLHASTGSQSLPSAVITLYAANCLQLSTHWKLITEVST